MSQSPLSEGEIVSGDEEKAISTNAKQIRDSKVNMSTRLPSGSSSRAPRSDGMKRLSSDMHHHFRSDAAAAKYRRSRSRSRSPYRAGKPVNGDKRRHEDDHYNRKTGSDPRRFKVHYEDGRAHADTAHRSRRPHADLDSPSHPGEQLLYDDRGPPQRPGRDRARSRSPFRHNKASTPTSSSLHDASQNHDGASRSDESDFHINESEAKADAQVKISLSQHAKRRSGEDGDVEFMSVHSIAPGPDSANYVSSSTSKDEDQESTAANGSGPPGPKSEAELIEERRKRREAIKAKHKQEPSLLVQALEQNMPSAPATPLHDSTDPSEQQSPPTLLGSPQTPHRDSPPDSPAEFAVTNDEELVDRRNAGSDDEGTSAADYDPMQDMEEDRPEFKKQEQQPMETAPQAIESIEQEIQAKGSAVKPTKEFDMFADDNEDDDDMFAPNDLTAKAGTGGVKEARTLDESLLDNWDYPDGHYRIILGELLDGRYAVQQQIGKGTFATVVRAQDTRTGNAVALKIACNNETMYKAGQKEMDMLQVLNQNDPDDKKHIIRLLRNFDHKGHLCLVFENLSADLREILKKFGRGVGINLKAIRSYAQQMFLSLSHLKKCQILHADLKPDNILVSEKRNLLKVCDLGTAAFANDAEVTPYLVSRFYRAPEVILGIPFDYAIDMWSIGCTLFELYTGKILFAGADNNQMLRAIQESRGKFPVRMLKRSTLAEKHFDLDGNFFSQERDKITGKAMIRQVNFNKTVPGKDLRSRLSYNTKGMNPDELKEHAALVDLMDKCLQLDPARRINPNDALRHGFIAHAVPQPRTESSTVKVAMNFPRRV